MALQISGEQTAWLGGGVGKAGFNIEKSEVGIPDLHLEEEFQMVKS